MVHRPAEVATVRLGSGCLPAFKQLPSSFPLRVARIPNLEPAFAVPSVTKLGDDSFQVSLACQTEELHAVPLDVVGIQKHGWLLGNN